MVVSNDNYGDYTENIFSYLSQIEYVWQYDSIFLGGSKLCRENLNHCIIAMEFSEYLTFYGDYVAFDSHGSISI